MPDICISSLHSAPAVPPTCRRFSLADWIMRVHRPGAVIARLLTGVEFPETGPRLRHPCQQRVAIPKLGVDAVGFALGNMKRMIGTLGGKGDPARRRLVVDQEVICAHDPGLSERSETPSPVVYRAGRGAFAPTAGHNQPADPVKIALSNLSTVSGRAPT